VQEKGKNMKISTGVVRKLDELGRIVLPKEYRKILEIKERDYIEMRIEGADIVIHKYENRCVFCSKTNPEHSFEEKKICKNCLKKLVGGINDKKV